MSGNRCGNPAPMGTLSIKGTGAPACVLSNSVPMASKWVDCFAGQPTFWGRVTE